MSEAERQAVELLINRVLQAAIVLFGAGYFARRAWRKAGLPTLPVLAWAGVVVSGVSIYLTHLVRELAPAGASPQAPEPANERTNEPTPRPRTALHTAADKLQLDRSRAGVVALLVAAGWKTTDIRNMLKGTAEDIGADVKAAQAALVEPVALTPVAERPHDPGRYRAAEQAKG